MPDDTAADAAASAAASRAFSSLNWRYVFVFGTVSDRNSRLSILEIAVAVRPGSISVLLSRYIRALTYRCLYMQCSFEAFAPT